MEDNLVRGYQLLEQIGSGSFGTVYKAQQTTIDREVAIKIIHPKLANRPTFIRQFDIEAQLIAQLEHLHITPLYDYWRDTQGAYLVMRYFRGGSLRDTLRNGNLSPETVNLVLQQVATGLALAHRKQIIHRDLKPGNILLDEDHNAYLADFGIAKQTLSINDELEFDKFQGTPDYIAPELAQGEPATPLSDIYSLGVIIYELLAGEHAFPNLTAVERLFKHLEEPLPLIQNFDWERLDDINSVIQRATNKNPTKRFANVIEMATAFQKALAIGQQQEDDSVVMQLTPREQEILHLLIEGLSTNAIAEELFITVATVRWYLRQIYRKLGVRSRVQAIVRGRKLNLVVQNEASSVNTASPSHEPDNPYKGLSAFQVGDAHQFYGREKIIQEIVHELDEGTRFLALVGASGSGKSSLVKAGLIPHLYQGGISGSDQWFVVEMTPGTNPLDELEIALIRVATDTVHQLHEHLRRDERGLLRIGQLILPDDMSELVIVIDQFEEVFTQLDDEMTLRHFFRLIQRAVIDPNSRIRIVITLRADFYDRPLMYPQLAGLLQHHTFPILLLNAVQLEQAIVEPAQQVGVTFSNGLVASIIEEVSY